MTRLFVIDLDGVLYLGEEVIPGSGEALAAVVQAGHQVVFCTNNSSRTRIDLASKIERLTGFPATADQVLNSAEAAAAMVGPTNATTLIIGGAGVAEAFEPLGIRNPAGGELAQLVVVGLDLALSYERLSEATLAIRAGARFIATNRDATFPTPRGQLPGAGSIVALLETATGCKAESAGKPERPMRDLIRARAAGRPVTVVGDRIDTDLEMAFAEGWGSVLVLTGVTAAHHDSRPDTVLSDIGGLIDLVGGG